MRATLSILGLYNWDTSIFENLVVPNGVDPAIAISTIIYDNAELEILYPDPSAMTYFIGLWSSRELPLWTRYLNAIQAEYNPIENYNRTEETTETIEEETSGSSTETGTRSPNLKSTNKVAGYNEDILVPSNETDETGSETASSNNTGSGSRDVTRNNNSNIHGNIGVTSNQQMLEQEFNIIPKLDIYHYISESFKRRFCLMVY